LVRFWRENQSKETNHLSFGAQVPCEENDNWYKDHCDRWGTKWDVCNADGAQPGDDWACFDTAWSPPIQWITTVSELYPHLQFELQYEEGGCDFAGVLILVAGEIISHEEYDYHSRPWGDSTTEESSELDEHEPPHDWEE